MLCQDYLQCLRQSHLSFFSTHMQVLLTQPKSDQLREEIPTHQSLKVFEWDILPDVLLAQKYNCFLYSRSLLEASLMARVYHWHERKGGRRKKELGGDKEEEKKEEKETHKKTVSTTRPTYQSQRKIDLPLQGCIPIFAVLYTLVSVKLRLPFENGKCFPDFTFLSLRCSIYDAPAWMKWIGRVYAW